MQKNNITKEINGFLNRSLKIVMTRSIAGQAAFWLHAIAFTLALALVADRLTAPAPPDWQFFRQMLPTPLLH